MAPSSSKAREANPTTSDKNTKVSFSLLRSGLSSQGASTVSTVSAHAIQQHVEVPQGL